MILKTKVIKKKFDATLCYVSLMALKVKAQAQNVKYKGLLIFFFYTLSASLVTPFTGLVLQRGNAYLRHFSLDMVNSHGQDPEG